MNVAIFGGTGYLGSHLVDALVAHGHYPVLLVRPGSKRNLPESDRYRIVSGDSLDGDAMRRVISGNEAVIYNVGILREFPRRGISFQSLQYEKARDAMDIATELGVERFVLTSANGVKPNGTTYQRTKYLAEQHLRASGLAGTVLRPSAIFGDPRGHMEFATQLYEQIVRPPLPAPLFYEGSLRRAKPGTFRLSPVHVEDVVRVYAKALTDPNAIGKTWSLCGPDALEWRAIIRIIGRAVGRDKRTLPVSASQLKMAAGFFGRFGDLPVTADQLTMLMEGNTGDSSAVFKTYGIRPTPFNEETLSYLRR
uniref:NADH dehydrogenase n=1 Tax=Candidatus Kentrum sp. FM TaxID=2126340 RepID=A0A450TPG5_9GAMM|nr:MAG: NADH dehydrogenase [Candidatus Kentron sp. FM]VFJ70549.1 MAG: NADH dehydrogenase [Candidatus Kentron sp. FM]VFK18053.1 MAG: NADH dehydrogenase [Candidatus Kentron sp. FM]